MPQPGQPAARGHLRLAGAPVEPRAADSRAALLVRSAVAALTLAVLTLLALATALVALAPLAWRRAPLGVRLRPIRAREARIIPFQPRQPRQKALPR